MPDFTWKGIKNTQYLNGTISALTRDEAAFKLKEDGVIITQLLKAARDAGEHSDRQPFKFKIKLTFPRKVKLVKIMIALMLLLATDAYSTRQPLSNNQS
jgi:type IV pilus assembly protein PilC